MRRMARGSYEYSLVTGMDVSCATLRCIAFIDESTWTGRMPTVGELAEYIAAC